MSIWFLYFFFYSFVGFLFEIAFARATRCRKVDRKCFIFLPLCPVYGFGALAILALPGWFYERPFLFFLAGGLVATAVEYLTAVFYEEGVGISFWDYSDLKGNIAGRVCLLFTFFWGILACVLAYGLHPLAAPILQQVSAPLIGLLFSVLAADAILSLSLLRKTGSTDSLKWYAAPPRQAAI